MQWAAYEKQQKEIARQVCCCAYLGTCLTLCMQGGYLIVRAVL